MARRTEGLMSFLRALACGCCGVAAGVRWATLVCYPSLAWKAGGFVRYVSGDRERGDVLP